LELLGLSVVTLIRQRTALMSAWKLTLGDEAVAIRTRCLPIRDKVQAASPHSVVIWLRCGKERRLTRSVWRVGPVVGTQVIRDI
jgi:hypothetical protein